MSSKNSAVVPIESHVSDMPMEDDGSWRVVLARIKKAVAGAKPIHEKPSLFRPMPGQPREYFDDGASTRLKESVAEVGQVQFGMARKVPVNASGAIYEILDGERRWRVVSQLALDVYRALLVEIDDEAAPYIIAAISNFNREGHTPTEISDAIHKLRHGLKVPMPEIAKMFGFSTFYAYQLHGLQNLHTDVRAMLDPQLAKDRILPTTAAIEISKLDPDLQTDVANRVLNKVISLRTLRGEVMQVGDAHGSPVRTRSVALSHQWSALQNAARLSVENAGIFAGKLKDPGWQNLLAERGNDVDINVMLLNVEQTIKYAQEAKTILQASLKKRS